MARPELFDTRPGWGGGKLNATSILLEPLSDAECRELISNLLDRAPLPPDASSRGSPARPRATRSSPRSSWRCSSTTRCSRASDDRWVAASDLSELPVPSTINALLAARLEGLPADERAILTAAAVEGTVFHRGAVRELAARIAERDARARSAWRSSAGT